MLCVGFVLGVVDFVLPQQLAVVAVVAMQAAERAIGLRHGR